MASFTPLNRRPTKSLNKEKMRHFLAKRKWKVTQRKEDYSKVLASDRNNLDACFCKVCKPVQFSLLNLQKTGKAVLALKRMANLYNSPDSAGSSSEGNTHKETHRHNGIVCPRSTRVADDSPLQSVTSSLAFYDQFGLVSILFITVVVMHTLM